MSFQMIIIIIMILISLSWNVRARS